jgi:hypothetical protein
VLDALVERDGSSSVCGGVQEILVKNAEGKLVLVVTSCDG